ncbi:MAG: lysostaphin resistance A-like protein [Nitrospiria bacterium]
MKNITAHILYLGILWGIGWFFSIETENPQKRRTLFDRQTWSIWLGVIIAALIELVNITTGYLSGNRPAIWIVYIFGQGAMLLALLYFYRCILKRPFAALGLSHKGLARRLIAGCRWITAYFLIGNALFYTLSQTLLHLLKRPDLLAVLIDRQTRAVNQGTALMNVVETELGTGRLWIPVIFLIIIGPLLEEIVFRGLLFGPMRRKMGPSYAIFMTAILFMLGHGGFGQSTFLFGLLLAYLYESTQSLIPSILFHMVLNIRTVAFYFERNETHSIAEMVSSAGTQFLFYGLILSILEGLHRKIKLRRTPIKRF